MDRKKIFYFVVFALLGLIFIPFIQSIIEGEKGKIKRVIYSGKRAIEKEDLMRLSRYISFDYQDKYGNDRSSIIFLGRTFFQEYQDISLKIAELKIELNESGGLAEMEVLVLAKRSAETEDDSPLEYDRVKLKLNFKNEQGDWRVIELDKKRGQATFLILSLFLKY